MAQLRLDFCVPRYVRARRASASSVAGPSVQEPSIHPLPCPLTLSRDSGMGWPASAKSISLLLLSLQVQTNLGSTNKSFLRPSVRPSARWKLGSVAMECCSALWMFGSIFRVWRGAVARPLSSCDFRVCACFYGQYPTALIGAAKRFQADPEPYRRSRCSAIGELMLPSPTDPRWERECNLLSYLFILCVRSQVYRDFCWGCIRHVTLPPC